MMSCGETRKAGRNSSQSHVVFPLRRRPRTGKTDQGWLKVDWVALSFVTETHVISCGRTSWQAQLVLLMDCMFVHVLQGSFHPMFASRAHRSGVKLLMSLLKLLKIPLPQICWSPCTTPAGSRINIHYQGVYACCCCACTVHYTRVRSGCAVNLVLLASF